MHLKVVLFGFQDDQVDADRLAKLLKGAFPSRRIHETETGERMLVEYILSYDVVHRHKMIWTDGNQLAGMDQVELCLATGLVQALTKKQVENKYDLIVDVQDMGLELLLSKFVDLINFDATTKELRDRRYHHTVFVLNPDVHRAINLDLQLRHTSPEKRLTELHHQAILRAKHKPRYKYRYRGSLVNGPIFSSRGRFVVIDVNALGTSFGPSESPEGVVVPHIFPSIAIDSTDMLLAKLNHLITEALERVFFPDVTSEQVSPSKLLLVPIFVFKNHRKAFQETAEFGKIQPDVDVPMLLRKLQALQIPRTRMQVVFGVHNLYDHTHVATALSRAMTTVNDHKLRVASLKDFLHSNKLNPLGTEHTDDDNTRTFVNGQVLLGQLVESADEMTYDLLAEMGQTNGADELLKSFFGMSNAEHGRRSSMMRIFPVFVFSVEGKPPGHLLFENYETNFANSHGAVVLQSNWTDIEVPFFLESMRKTVHLDATKVTGSVLEALVKGVGNISPPHIKWSEIHNRTVLNYLWSGGGSFGGPFSRLLDLAEASVSENVRENAIRNNLIVLIHSAVKASRHVLRMLLDFELEFGLTKHTHLLAEDLQSGHVGRVTAARIKVNLKRMQGVLARVASIFNENVSMDNGALFDLANELPSLARSLVDDAVHSLDRARSRIACCKVVTRTITPGRGAGVWMLVIVLLVVGLGATGWIFRTRFMASQKKKRVI